MFPNPYVVDQMARHKEEEMQRLVKYAWLLPPRRRPALRQRLGTLLVIASLLSGSLLWMLA